MTLRTKFLAALVCYAAIALFAWVVMTGPWRLAVWVLMAGFAVKTWIAYRQMGE